MSDNNDFIDRKVSGFERLFTKFFEAIQRDAKSFFIVILVFSNIYFFYMYSNSLELRLDEREIYSDRIINEVKRQMRPEINNNINERVQKVETKVDSARSSFLELTEAFKKATK